MSKNGKVSGQNFISANVHRTDIPKKWNVRLVGNHLSGNWTTGYTLVLKLEEE